MSENIYGDNNNPISYIFNIITIFILFFQLFLIYRTYKSDHKRRKNESTIEYLKSMRNSYRPLIKEINDKSNENFINYSEVDEKFKHTINEYLSIMEAFSVGVNNGVYDLYLTNRMSGNLLTKMFERLQAFIEVERIQKNFGGYAIEYEILYNRLGKLRKKNKIFKKIFRHFDGKKGKLQNPKTEIEMEHLWDYLYQENRINFGKPAKCIIDSMGFFHKEKVEKILDLGCGSGRNTLILLKEGFKVSACDISNESLKQCFKRIKEFNNKLLLALELKQCNMTKLPYSKNYFDAIISISVINHGAKSSINETFKEINRVLKQHGYFIFTVASKEHPTFGHGNKIDADTYITNQGIDKGIVHYFFDEESLNKIITENGFELIEMKKAGKKEICGVNEGHIFAFIKKV